MRRLYLYLASRSKEDIKIVTVLQGDQPVNSNLERIEDLALPPVWQRHIERICHENRMLYHPRLETAKNYEELKSTLKSRGYRNLPMGVQPMLNMSAYVKAPMANTSSCKIQKTMIRRLKR